MKNAKDKERFIEFRDRIIEVLRKENGMNFVQFVAMGI